MGCSNMEKKHFILVHGVCHGAWCWYKVSSLLRSAGHKVTAIDLAACGIDPRPTNEIATFAEYSQPLLEVMASLPPEEKIILVGHSLGGINIALAMERFPEKIGVAIFVAAFMPDCTSRPSHVLEEYARWIPGEVWMDIQCGFGRGATKPPTSMLFGPQFMSSRVYNCCSLEDLALATSLLKVGPFVLEDLSNKLSLSKERYGSVDMFYITCGEDLAILEDFQQWMIQNNPVKDVKKVEKAGHMPMLSRPQDLCQCLLDIANTYA